MPLMATRVGFEESVPAPGVSYMLPFHLYMSHLAKTPRPLCCYPDLRSRYCLFLTGWVGSREQDCRSGLRAGLPSHFASSAVDMASCFGGLSWTAFLGAKLLGSVTWPAEEPSIMRVVGVIIDCKAFDVGS
jgi:hypothetical protein